MLRWNEREMAATASSSQGGNQRLPFSVIDSPCLVGLRVNLVHASEDLSRFFSPDTSSILA